MVAKALGLQTTPKDERYHVVIAQGEGSMSIAFIHQYLAFTGGPDLTRVGSSKTFWIANAQIGFLGDQGRDVPATCRAVMLT